MKKEVAPGQPLFSACGSITSACVGEVKLGKAGIYLQTPVPVRFSFFQVGMNKQNS